MIHAVCKVYLNKVKTRFQQFFNTTVSQMPLQIPNSVAATKNRHLSRGEPREGGGGGRGWVTRLVALGVSKRPRASLVPDGHISCRPVNRERAANRAWSLFILQEVSRAKLSDQAISQSAIRQSANQRGSTTKYSIVGENSFLNMVNR